jgi:hypothetical protein
MSFGGASVRAARIVRAKGIGRVAATAARILTALMVGIVALPAAGEASVWVSAAYNRPYGDLAWPGIGFDFNVHLQLSADPSHPWEGELGGAATWIVDYDLSTNQGGTMNITPRINPDGHIYALDVEVTDVTIQDYETVWIYADIKLNNWNNAVISDYRSHFGEHGWSPGDFPDIGFTYPRPPTSPGSHETTFYFLNAGTRPLILESMTWMWDQEWHSAREQTAWSGHVLAETRALTVAPGAAFAMDLVIPHDGRSESYIYASGIVRYQTGEGLVASEIFFGHQEEFMTSTSVDAPASSGDTWGKVKVLYR